MYKQENSAPKFIIIIFQTKKKCNKLIWKYIQIHKLQHLHLLI